MMTTESQSQSRDLDYALMAKTTFVHSVRNTLQALFVVKKEDKGNKGDVIVTIEPTGIKFTVEDSTSAQGNAFLPDSVFQEYHFHRTKEQFKTKLHLLIETLSMFGTHDKEGEGTNPVAQFFFHPEKPLHIMLECNGVTIQASVSTLEIEHPPIQFNLRAAEIPAKLIMKSANLADALNELDWSNKNCTLTIAPELPYFRLASDGPAGSCQIDYPKDSDAFETYECAKRLDFIYKLKHMHMCVKAIAGSIKTQIRVNSNGLMQLQNMFTFSDGQHCFINFFIMPESDDS